MTTDMTKFTIFHHIIIIIMVVVVDNKHTSRRLENQLARESRRCVAVADCLGFVQSCLELRSVCYCCRVEVTDEDDDDDEGYEAPEPSVAQPPPVGLPPSSRRPRLDDSHDDRVVPDRQSL